MQLNPLFGILFVMNLDPQSIKKTLALTKEAKVFVANTRKKCKKLFTTQENLVLFVGPCSIHNPQSALAYAKKLAKLAHNVEDKITLVMRCFIEKSRTSIGWSGFVRDPYLDHSQNLEQGILQSRQLLISILNLKVPICMEIIDPFLLSYFDDLICWGFIGARSAESQLHRTLASGFDFPVGFKNPLDGNISTTINSLIVAGQKCSLLKINDAGRLQVTLSSGNPYCCPTLRGSKNLVNYSTSAIKKSIDLQLESGLKPVLIVDCAHGNSQKTCTGQINAFSYLIENIQTIRPYLLGIMLESFLNSGSQTKPTDPNISITDPCLDFETSSLLINKLYQALSHESSACVDTHTS